MKKIDKILQKQVNVLGLTSTIKSAHICYVVDQLGDKRYRVISFKNGILVIGVNNGYVATEINHEKKEIMDKINNRLKSPVVKSIKFKIIE